MLGDIEVKEKKNDSYLGDKLCSEGLRACIEETVKDRTEKIKGSIYELQAPIEDFRMQIIGGVQGEIYLYEACIIPSLLTNCGTWTEITVKEEKLLSELQNTFCRALLQVPCSAPKPSLRDSFGLLEIKWRIMEAKVLLVMTIRSRRREH